MSVSSDNGQLRSLFLFVLMTTIVDTLERYRIPLKRYGEHHHTTRKWVQTDCPSCSPGWEKYRLGWNITSGLCSCWHCGKQNPASALASLAGVSYQQAVEALQDITAAKLAELPKTRELVNPTGVGPLQPQHKKYLKSRYYYPNKLERIWGVRGIGIHAELSWRIWIPIFDKFGRQVSWTTRATDDSIAKRYISARADQEIMSHRHVLYGAEHALHTIIIVEGPFDAWKIGPGAVATLGMSYTKEQMLLATEYPTRVVCFDSTPSAQRRADKLCKELSQFPGITEKVCLSSGMDPASAHPFELRELRSIFLANEVSKLS